MQGLLKKKRNTLRQPWDCWCRHDGEVEVGRSCGCTQHTEDWPVRMEPLSFCALHKATTKSARNKILSHMSKHSKNLPNEETETLQKVQLWRQCVHLVFHTQKRPIFFHTVVYLIDRSHIKYTVPHRLDQIPRSQWSNPTSDWETIDPIDNQCWRAAWAVWSLEVQLIQLILIVSHLALVPVLLMLLSLGWLQAPLHFEYLTRVVSLLMKQKQRELPGIWLKILKTASSKHLTKSRKIFAFFNRSIKKPDLQTHTGYSTSFNTSPSFWAVIPYHICTASMSVRRNGSRCR